uniref:Uncharacterized protein n=1 Tax=Tanacetum cinerariifolium TaxID=118510 RepID=A0A699J269_TANCI|nr:hypothetical protein [Tanacetum cinerariifolium]
MQMLDGGKLFMAHPWNLMWTLETYRVGAFNFFTRLECDPRAVAWRSNGTKPYPRLTSDALEAKADWWVSSRAFFDGLINEPPPTLSPAHQDMIMIQKIFIDVWRNKIGC